MAIEPDDDEMEALNAPVFDSFHPLKWFFYAGSAFNAVLAVFDFAIASQSAWTLKLTLAFCEHVFWAIGCIGIGRIARSLSPPNQIQLVKPPTHCSQTL